MVHFRKEAYNLSSILANGANFALLAEEDNVWKRIFGLDAQTLMDTSITLIAMLVLFMLLSYLLFNPARKLIASRQELIAKDMADAQKNRTDAEALKIEYDSKLSSAYAEADEIMSSAKKRAKKQETDMINDAKEEANRIMKRAHKEAELEKNRVQDEVKQEMIAVASLMAGKIINVSMDEASQNELVDATLKEMGEETWQN